MLPKQNRLSKKKDLERVFKQGRFFKNDFFTLRLAKNNSKNAPRFGIIVSGKVSKKAAVRNKVKRRIRAAVKDLIAKAKPGTEAVIIALPQTAKKKFQEIKEQLTLLFRKSGILK